MLSIVTKQYYYITNKKENIEGEKKNSLEGTGEKREHERDKNEKDYKKYEK